MKRTIAPAFVCAGLLGTGLAQAKDLRVEVTNLIYGTDFTPLTVTAHGSDTDPFEVGTPASAHLQAMAYGGDIRGLVDADPAGGAAT